MRKIYRRLGYILILLLLLVTIFIFDITFESNEIDKDIIEFKSRAVYVDSIDNFNYYKVIKKYDYEDSSNICNNYTDISVGTIGDIYVTNSDPFGGFFVTEWISKYAWIGHAGMIYNEEGTKTIEIIGNGAKEDNVVKIYDNDWLEKVSSELMVLRVKDISKSDKSNIINEGEEIFGRKYDYTFLLGGNKRFYCLSLVSYIYKKIDIKLNNDMFFTRFIFNLIRI